MESHKSAKSSLTLDRSEQQTDQSMNEPPPDLAGDLDLEKRLEGEKPGVPAPQPLMLAADDPENPRNWPVKKKVLVNFTLCIWVLTLTYSSTAYVASLFTLVDVFHVSTELAVSGVTFIVLGFAAGPLVFGPASELYGRAPVYRATGLIYTAMAFASAFSPTMPGILISRFFMGFFGSSALNNVPASLGDFTTPVERGKYSILYALMAFGGPSLGPLCSSFIEKDAGFRWNFRVMAIFVGIMSLLVAFVPETHGPTLAKRKLKAAGESPPPLPIRQVLGVFKTALARPFVYLFTEPTVMLVSLYLTLLYAILYGFFEAFALVWLDVRGFKTTSFGLTYIALGLGFLTGCVLLATLGMRFYLKRVAIAKAEGTKVQPEARLGLAFAGAFLAPCSLFLFAWTAPFPHVHWIVPCLAEYFFGVSMLLIFTAFIPYLIDVYLQTAASALAAGTASRALIGSIFPLFSIQMFDRLTIQGATSLLAGICVLLAPIPFVFNAYGTEMRRRSRYAIVQ